MEVGRVISAPMVTIRQQDMGCLPLRGDNSTEPRDKLCTQRVPGREDVVDLPSGKLASTIATREPMNSLHESIQQSMNLHHCPYHC